MVARHERRSGSRERRHRRDQRRRDAGGKLRFADRTLRAHTGDDTKVVLTNPAFRLEHLSKAYLCDLSPALLVELKPGNLIRCFTSPATVLRPRNSRPHGRSADVRPWPESSKSSPASPCRGTASHNSLTYETASCMWATWTKPRPGRYSRPLRRRRPTK